MSKAVIIVGVAGSGKTWTAYTLYEWFRNEDQDAYILNLDPGVDKLPYQPTFDIREYVDLWRVMDEYGLGPNGGLIVSMDLMVNYIEKINSVLRSLGTGLAIIDTPGQLEIFLYRPSGKILLDSLDVEDILLLYVVDGVFVRETRNLVASMLLGGTLRLRFDKPLLAAINKIDLLSDDEVERLMKLVTKPQYLKEEADKSLGSFEADFIYRLTVLMRRYGVYTDFIPISSLYMTNYDKLIASITRVLYGGEEYYTV